MALIDELKRLGVPVDADEGGVIDTTVMVYDVDQLKVLLDLGDSPEVSKAHHAALYEGINRSGEFDDGLVGRVNGYVLGANDLNDEDRERAKAAFPLTVSVLAAPGPWTVKTPQDLSTSNGSFKRVHVTDLTLEQGGYFTVTATPLLFTCNTFTRNGDTGSGASDFNIVGKTGTTPTRPATPPTATQSAKGKDGECSSAGVAGPGGQPGTPGATGTRGTDADPGGLGIPSQQATIVISEKLIASQVTIFTQSGLGGQGGTGGTGGTGQQGGNGGDGRYCDCTGNGGGPGSNGGPGGPGGKAGDGGDGADAAGNIVVRVPSQADALKILSDPQPAPPGAPGLRGDGGKGGSGGTGGAAGKNNTRGGDGGTGPYGPNGDTGSFGKNPGKAAQVLPQVN